MIFEKFFKVLLCLLVIIKASAQDFSNKGTEFWVGYGYHQTMHNGLSSENKQDMVLYFTSDVAASVTVDIPGVGYSKTYQVTPNNVTESDPIPKSGSQDSRLLTEGKFKTGIHITSDHPVVAYAHEYDQSVSGASLLFPVATLGQDYYSLNFTQRANQEASNSWAFVVATEDNTTVEITPSANTLGSTAGQTFTVVLNKGEIYNIMGTTSGNNGVDLTGTRIRSVSTGTSACKKIAVFSGAGRLSINCDNAVSSSDNVIQQVFPRSAWGRKYLTVPTTLLPNNYFRIAVSDPATIVTIDGVAATNLQNGFYYEINANTPKMIVADKPVMVAQYITSANTPTCGNSSNTKGDPEMIYLSPVEQTIDNITLNSTSHYQITSHYINVIIKSEAINNFTLDGVKKASSFTPYTQDASYSYAVFPVSAGAHNLRADSGFNAIAYGYGGLESYGYNAGTNIKDLYQFITIKNPYATVNFPATCKNTNLKFIITVPFKASTLTWDFRNNTHISPNQNVTQNSPVPDSTYISDGRNLYVYSLPSFYSFDATGIYPVKIIASNQTSDGCNGEEEISYDINVSNPPTTDFTFSQNGCATDTIGFFDASIGNGRTVEHWRWQFTDATTDTAKNTRKAFPGSGTYNVKHTSINDIGCFADTSKPFTIAPQPIANFGISKPACVSAPITFTDSSTIAAGQIVKWYWDFGNGNQITSNNNLPLIQYYNTEGNFTVSLQVENAAGCKSTIVKKNVVIHPFPIVNFEITGACLPSANARFTNLTTITDGTENALTYLWNFGDGGTAASKNPSHTYETEGPFNITLKATSQYGCSKDTTQAFSKIYPKPVAGFSFSPGKICVTDSVYFTDTSRAKNSSVINWFWNFGDGTTSNMQSPVKKITDSGSYIVTLVAGSAAGCISDTLKRLIKVNKSPEASFSISGSTCEKLPFTITDHSKSNSGTISNWYWSYGDGTSETRLNGTPFLKSYNTAGSYTLALVVVTDNGCKSDTAKQTAIVRRLPVVNFILPNVCVNDPFAAFTDSSYLPGSEGTASLTYKWNFGDPNATAANPNTSSVQNPQHKYSAAGTYDVSLAVTSNTGCSVTNNKPVTINSGSPKPDFSVVNNGPLCGNSEVMIKNNSSVDIGKINKIELIWDFENNPNVIQTDTAPFIGKVYYHTFSAVQTTTTYQVKMRAYSGASCVNEKASSITVNPSPKISFPQPPPVCLGDRQTITLHASETSGLTGTFAFSGNGISSSAGVFSPSVAGAGESTIKYTFTSVAGCIDSVHQTIVVVANPVVLLPANVYVLEGGSVALSPSITGNVIKYLWSPPTYLNDAAAQRPVTSPKENITYRLTVTTAEGCTGNGMTDIVLLKNLGVPNAFSPNGDGINDVWNIAALSSYANCTVEVFNRYGAIVFSSIGYSKPWDGTFKGSALPVGVYYYIINPKNGLKPISGYVTILK